MLLLLLVLFSLVDDAMNIRVLVVWFVLGIIGLVHMVQQRTLRSHHEDSHYCAKNYKNLRHYAILLKQKLVEAGSDASVSFISSDDKAKVCVTFKLRYPINVC